MGNFQYLAEQVLHKNNANQAQVSSFLPLGGETGNLRGKEGNQQGNFNVINDTATHGGLDIQKETYEETKRKLKEKNEETLPPKNTLQSFLSVSMVSIDIFNNDSDILCLFFDNACRLNTELLTEDKRWLKTICFDVRPPRLKTIIEKYIHVWTETMAQEPVEYKKQNSGRFAANTFIRDELRSHWAV